MCLFLRYAVSTVWERQQVEGRSPPDIHKYFCCCARRIGNMFALVSYQDGTPMVIAGPCWPFCAFVTVPLILGVTGTVCYFLIIDSSYSSLVSEKCVSRSFCVRFPLMLTYLLSIPLIARVATLSVYSCRGVCPFQSFLCQLSRSWTHGACDGEFAVCILPSLLS